MNSSSSFVALVEEGKVERNQVIVIVIVAVHDVVAAAMIVLLAVLKTIKSLR